MKNCSKLNAGFLVIVFFINVKNTEAMLFGIAPRLAREKSLFNICIDGKQIERVHEFTYLGVVFDERLS